MPKITAKYLNSRIKALKDIFGEEGYTAITDLHFIQEEYAGIINPYNVKKAGQFRSYNEVNKYRKTYAKKKGLTYTPISKENYTKQLEKFYNKYSERLYAKSEKIRLKNGYISSYETYIGEVDVSNWSFNDLRNAFKNALDRMPNGKRNRNDSGDFFKYVEEEINLIYERKYKK